MRKDLGDKMQFMPLPVLMLATYDQDGKANVMNAAWGGVYDYNQVYVSLSKHKTTDNLELKKAFTLSFATKKTEKISDYFGVVSGNKEDDICFFSQDSRQMKNGGMYIPLKGERFDGHDFIESAFQTGATAIITAKDVSYPDKIVIKVEDTYQALKDMAIYLRSHRPVKVVGGTGSVRKTSTRDMVYSVVKQKYKTLKTEGNYNNEIGLPLTILRYQDEEVMVLEMGMNHLNEMSRLSMIAHPDVSCITNVGTAHIGELGSRENILKAKLEITDGMKDQSTLIINNDNDMLQTVDLPRLNVVRVGKNEGASIQASDIELFEDHSTFIVQYHDQSEKIWVPVQGEQNVFNGLIAIAVG